jgi:hypothetical protein
MHVVDCLNAIYLTGLKGFNVANTGNVAGDVIEISIEQKLKLTEVLVDLINSHSTKF